MADEVLTKDQIEAIREYVKAPPSSHIAQRLIETIDARDAEIASLRSELAEARESVHASHYTVETLIRERDEARRERDERPKISRSDAAAVRFDLWAPNGADDECDAADRVENALRAHAAGSDAKGGENG